MEQNGDRVELRDDPLDIAAAIEFASDPKGGAVAVFLGTTRAEIDSRGRELVALDYEAYREMAEAQMRRLADEARKSWKILRLALLHRVGRVNVKEPSVLVAVSTPHRADAFAACKFLIDQLKAEATIWKKEVWADGSSTWVDGHGG
jgi:molybdopterin synthase catalytic subunit